MEKQIKSPTPSRGRMAAFIKAAFLQSINHISKIPMNFVLKFIGEESFDGTIGFYHLTETKVVNIQSTSKNNEYQFTITLQENTFTNLAEEFEMMEYLSEILNIKTYRVTSPNGVIHQVNSFYESDLDKEFYVSSRVHAQEPTEIVLPEMHEPPHPNDKAEIEYLKPNLAEIEARNSFIQQIENMARENRWEIANYYHRK